MLRQRFQSISATLQGTFQGTATWIRLELHAQAVAQLRWTLWAQTTLMMTLTVQRHQRHLQVLLRDMSLAGPLFDYLCILLTEASIQLYLSCMQIHIHIHLEIRSF